MQRLKKIGVFSLAKIMSLLGLLVGLVAGVVYGLFVMLLGAGAGASAERGGSQLLAFGIGGGLITMILVPLVYAAAGFLAGLVYGLIINFVLYLSGGLELRIESPGHPGATK
jgi:hypothetical protein